MSVEKALKTSPVRFSQEERRALLGAHQMGPKMVEYLELIGVATLQALAKRNPAQLRHAINAHLGRPHINAMGEYALEQAVAAAKAHLAGRSGEG